MAAVMSTFISSIFCSLPSILLAFIASWLLIHGWNHRHCKGPPSWPLLGSSVNLLFHADNLHDYLTFYLKKFPTFKISYPGFDSFYTAVPRNVEHMLKINFSNYVKGSFTSEKLQELLGDGFVSVDGAAWKQQRKVASFEFSSRILREFSESAFRDHAAKLANLLIQEAKAQRPVELQDAIMRMALDSVCKVSFGVEMNNLSDSPSAAHLQFATAVDRASQALFWRFIDPSWKLKRWLGLGAEAELVKDINTINTYVFKLLEDRKKEMEQVGDASDTKPDLLSRFLALSRADPEEFTDTKIRDITFNFLLAGRDTTSVTLCWFFYMLLENPQVEEKIVQEVLDVVEADGDRGELHEVDGLPSESRIRKFAELLTKEKLSNMHYLHASLAETLRLYPALPLNSRVAVSDDILPDGTRIKKGDVVGYHAFGMGRMERVWGEDAENFRPERFLRDGIYTQESPFKHVAFHGGPRTCLGKDFAYLQMKVTAAVLLRFFKFQLLAGQKVRYRLNMTLYQEGLKVHILPRSIHPGHSSSSS